MSYKVFVMEDDPGLVQAVMDLLAGRGYMLNVPSPGHGEITSIRFGGIRVDFQKSEVIRGRTRVALSERENRLLRFLIMHRGAAVSRDTLLEYVWGYRQAPLTRTVDVTILRLRQKIETNPAHPQFIITVPGVGYRFRG